MKSKKTLLTLTLLFLFSSIMLSAQDCDNDNAPPVVICENGLTVSAIPDFGAIIWAQDIDQGSYDNCSAVSLFITLADDDTGTPPSTNAIQLPPELGTYVVVLYAVDQSGNFSVCWSEVTITGFNSGGCTSDEDPPIPICLNNTIVALGPDGTATLLAEDYIISANDNCDDDPSLSINLVSASTGAPQGSNTLVLNTPGPYVVELWATDDFGNADFCEALINIVETPPNSCEDDTTTPVAICENGLSIEAIPDFGVFLWAQDIDQGSYDNCSAVSLFITLADDDTGTPPSTNAIQLPPELGTYVVVLYAVDQSGNFSVCWAEVTITGFNSGGCTSDNTPPTLICIAGLTANLPIGGQPLYIYGQDFTQSVSDDCDNELTYSVNLQENSTGAPQGSNFVIFNEPGTYSVEVWVIDDFGNAASCETFIEVLENPFDDCENDTLAPNVICENNFTVLPLPGEDVVIWASDVNEGSFDWCSEVELRIILVEDSDGTLPATEFISLPPVAATYEVEMWAVDASGNTNYCLSTVVVNDPPSSVIGKVFLDADDDCTFTAGETGLEGWQVRVSSTNSSRTQLASTNSDGTYAAFLNWPAADLLNVNVELLIPEGLATACVSSVTIPELAPGELLFDIDFPAVLADDCNYLTVDVAVPFLRRCFENPIQISYSNYALLAAENATITVDLDPFLLFQSASVPATDLGNGRYELELGTIAPTTTGQVSIITTLSCDAEFGATHCIQASILPFTCIPETNFAELTVSGECDDDNNQVNFTIANTGTNNMAAAQNYRIVEDVIMYMNQDPIQLDAGDSESFSYPANGATWRLEIEQDASFPYGGIAAAFVEGCGGFTPGVATQFLLVNPKPNVDQLCLENIGAWDPNDKQALPRGYGEQHFIEANTPIEYLIRFQNTGTDTAFNVRIEDQLSEYLDPTSLVPGVASHPYRMELKEDGQLMFHFDNIMLPDSNINASASNGFVQFSIRQLPDNPLGTIIENTAGIYFDFNEAVITNTVMHTIGEDFILVATQDILVPGLQLSIAPNPLQSSSLLKLEGMDLKNGQCLIYDSQGRMIGQKAFTGDQLRLDRSIFPQNGLYFFRLFEGQQALAQGKLVVK